MSTENLDLSAGKYLKGVRQDDHTFLVVTNFNQLQGVMRNPRDLQQNAKRSGSDAWEIEEEASIHELIQRALTGNKKSNVPVYGRYIEDVAMGRRQGVLPPIHLWSVDELDVVENGQNLYLLVPDGTRLLAIDGETQLAAHFEVHSSQLAEIRKMHGVLPLAAVVHHNVSVETARQYFHDLNVLAVRPNTSLSLAMDTVDPLMRIVTDLESRIPYLTGRVDKQSRQLNKNSKKVVTLQTLRQMTINVAKGIGGIQYGAKPVPLDGVDLDDLATVARDWFTAVFNTFATIVPARDTHLIAAGPVMAAIAALGKEILDRPASLRQARRDELLASLRAVDWRKGEHWSGIAGRYSPKGVFTVSGTKEVGYSVFNVLADSQNPNYIGVRNAA